MAKKLRLGLIGTGIAARDLYLPAFKELEHRIELVACANRRRKKAEDYARLAGIPKVVDTAEELIALPEVDAIVLSLPIDAQPEFVLKVLAAGKPLLSEKPIGPSVVAARRLLKAAARYRVPWLIGENFAFMPHVQRLEDWLRKGRLGDVRLVQAVQMSAMDKKNPYFNTSWRADPRHVGGFVVDGGVHVAHVVRRCFGMPIEVKSLTGCFNPLLPPIDTAIAVLQFASGALGTWTSCFSARYQGPLLHVYGSSGNAELSWGGAILYDAKGKASDFPAKVSSFTAEFEHFADVVMKGKPVAVTPEAALEDLALVEAIVAGGATGKASARKATKKR